MEMEFFKLLAAAGDLSTCVLVFAVIKIGRILLGHDRRILVLELQRQNLEGGCAVTLKNQEE